MIEEGIRWILLEDAAVAALVAKRVWLKRAQQRPKRPYVVFSRTSTQDPRKLSGSLRTPRGRFSVNCYATEPEDARRLANAVTEALDGFNGMAKSVRILECFLEDDRDLDEPAVNESRVLVDFIVRWRR